MGSLTPRHHRIASTRPESTRIRTPSSADPGCSPREVSRCQEPPPRAAVSSGRPPVQCRRTRDHPRGRGEQSAFFVSTITVRGPSPQARGADILNVKMKDWGRTLPASAGSSARPRPSSRCGRDHPRTRGEQYGLSGSPRPCPGPSPHARGAGGDPHVCPVAAGTIPARAGSSHKGRSAIRLRRDHPRTRGEQRLGDPTLWIG